MEEKTKRSASLTFRGFLKSPEEVESLVGVKAELLAQSGQPKTPNHPNVWPRSVAMFQVEFEDNAQIVDMIPAIRAHVGGLDRVRAALDQIRQSFWRSIWYYRCDILKHRKTDMWGFRHCRTLLS